MAEYRKRQGRDTWHWCKNCSNWPKGTNVVKRSSKPSSGELCNQCIAKDKNKDCKK